MNIQSVAEEAKRLLLKNGELPLCIFVEIDSTDIVIVGIVNEGRDARERAYLKFMAGRKFARKKLKKRQVTGVCEAVEVWMGSPGIRPSLHPERKEGLQIASIDMHSLKQSLVMYELIRDGSGKLIDLLASPWNDDEMETQSAGLPAFLAGIRTANQHDSLAIHEFRRTFEKYYALVQSSQKRNTND